MRTRERGEREKARNKKTRVRGMRKREGVEILALKRKKERDISLGGREREIEEIDRDREDADM